MWCVPPAFRVFSHACAMESSGRIAVNSVRRDAPLTRTALISPLRHVSTQPPRSARAPVVPWSATDLAAALDFPLSGPPDVERREAVPEVWRSSRSACNRNSAPSAAISDAWCRARDLDLTVSLRAVGCASALSAEAEQRPRGSGAATSQFSQRTFLGMVSQTRAVAEPSAPFSARRPSSSSRIARSFSFGIRCM
jgi:hypothetical protein